MSDQTRYTHVLAPCALMTPFGCPVVPDVNMHVGEIVRGDRRRATVAAGTCRPRVGCRESGPRLTAGGGSREQHDGARATAGFTGDQLGTACRETHRPSPGCARRSGAGCNQLSDALQTGVERHEHAAGGTATPRAATIHYGELGARPQPDRRAVSGIDECTLLPSPPARAGGTSARGRPSRGPERRRRDLRQRGARPAVCTERRSALIPGPVFRLKLADGYVRCRA